MSRYAVRWVDHARDQRDDLPADARRALDATLRLLSVDPRGHGTYDKNTEQWTAPFGGFGILLYSIEERWIIITVLRVSWAG